MGALDLQTNEKEVLRLYENGTSASEIGRLYGANYQTVLDFLRRKGVTIRRGPTVERRGVFKGREQEVIDMFLEGNSYAKIAAKLNCYPRSVAWFLKKRNIVRPKPQQATT
jgi:DNA-binding CsgD family transcriptional regulator